MLHDEYQLTVYRVMVFLLGTSKERYSSAFAIRTRIAWCVVMGYGIILHNRERSIRSLVREELKFSRNTKRSHILKGCHDNVLLN